MPGIEPTQRSYVHRIVNERIRSITPQLAIVTEAYPHSATGDDSNYEVDVRLLAGERPASSARDSDGDGNNTGIGSLGTRPGRTHHRVPVGVETSGASRGLQPGDMVLIQYLQGDSDAPIVTKAFYDAEQRAPLTEEGDWRRRIGDEAVIEIITKDDGTRQLNIGRQPDDREGIDAGLSINMDDGSIGLFDSDEKGLFADGKGNMIQDWESFASPWGAAGPVNWTDEGTAGDSESFWEHTVTVTTPDGEPVVGANVTIEQVESDGGTDGTGGETT